MDLFKMSNTNRFKIFLSLALVLFLSSGCVYFNTFYFARKSFNEAESQRKEAGRQASRAGAGGYKKAIEKTDKVLEKWPGSKWYDDALYINGVSHYYLEDYSKAEKRLRELVVNYPESKYNTEARLYLAKTRLKMGEEATAMTLFEQLFSGIKNKEVRAEAALALGEYYFENKDFAKAEVYFNSLIDSLGNSDDKAIGKMYIADSYFNRFRYNQALKNYKELLKFDLTSAEKYKAKFRAGECCYYLNDIEDGLKIFYELADNETYFDSLGVIKLKIAQGYEWEEELPLAIQTYEEVVVENERKPAEALANYNLGLIYQYDYEDYKKAKEYYDAAKAMGTRSEIYQDALERSSNIGKLESYLNREELDTAATMEDIDQAAETQYLLAELYLTQLGKPDSALHEFKYLADNFPDSYLAPKALIAYGLLRRDYYDDTLSYDSVMRKVLKKYPRSDYIPEAIDLLGLSGTIADSGYAAKYYEKGESFIFDHQNLDSARYYFRMIVDSFPRSDLNAKARYALLWLTANYDSPGDSSLYYEYALFADSFPNSEYGQAAENEIKEKIPKTSTELAGIDTTGTGAFDQDTTGGDTTTVVLMTPEERCQTDPDGNRIELVGHPPQRYDKEFIYPTAAYSDAFYGELCFQVKIDAFGDISDIRLVTPTPSEALNEEATDVVRSCHFDTYWIPPELRDSWFAFKYNIELPASLR
jgi:tetratricopeptide (TPR) repeat protein